MSADISNTDLIKLAVEVMNPKDIGDYRVGQVGAALVTEDGNVHRDVCLDVSSSLGFCAD